MTEVRLGHRASVDFTKAFTREFSKSFYLSTRMLPKNRQDATFALYGFCRYADNLSDRVRDRSRDEKMREINHLGVELEVAFRSGESEHPAIGPFIEVAKTFGIPKKYAMELLEGVKMDLTHTRYETFKDLYLFCYRVAGVVGLMMTYILGYKDDKAFEYAEKLGIALQLTNILRDVQEDKDMGRIYLPQEELRRFNISEDDIFSESFDERMHAFIKFQVERAHHYYKAAEPGVAMLNTNSQFAIYSAAEIYRGILHKVTARDFNPFLGRVYVPQKQKIRILLREFLKTKWRVLTEKLSAPAYDKSKSFTTRSRRV